LEDLRFQRSDAHVARVGGIVGLELRSGIGMDPVQPWQAKRQRGAHGGHEETAQNDREVENRLPEAEPHLRHPF
jgi:hypothetical protein